MANNLLQLPVDAVSHILSHVGWHDLHRLKLVCTHLNTTVLTIINNPTYWERRVTVLLEDKKPYIGGCHVMMAIAISMKRELSECDFVEFLMQLNIPDITIYFISSMSIDLCCSMANHWNPNTRRRQDIFKEIGAQQILSFYTFAEEAPFANLPLSHVIDSVLPAMSGYPLAYKKTSALVDAKLQSLARNIANAIMLPHGIDAWLCLEQRPPQSVLQHLHFTTITYDDLLRYSDDVEVTLGLLRGQRVREAYDIAVEMGLLEKATPEVKELYRVAGLPSVVVPTPTKIYAAIHHHVRHLRLVSKDRFYNYLATL